MFGKSKMKNIVTVDDVFLGGTCNESTWRDNITPSLTGSNISSFNPVVKDWDEKAYEQELFMRENCPVCLYVITDLMTGVYSIAEVVDDSNKSPKKTVFAVLKESGDVLKSRGILPLDKSQLKSLDKVGQMVKNNGGIYLGIFDSSAVLAKAIVEAVKNKI